MSAQNTKRTSGASTSSRSSLSYSFSLAIQFGGTFTPKGNDHLIGGGFLRRGRTHNLIGYPGSGKSLVAVHEALCLVTGTPFFGRNVAKSRVLFVAAEAGKSTLERFQVAAAQRDLEWPLPDLHVAPLAIDLKNSEWVEVVKAALERLQCDVIIIDTAAAAGTGDEGPQDMPKFVAGLNRLSSPEVAIQVIHHTPYGDSNRERGHSSFRGTVDASFTVKKNDTAHVIGASKERDGHTDGEFGQFRVEAVDRGITNLDERWIVPCLRELVTTDAPKQPKETYDPNSGESEKDFIIRKWNAGFSTHKISAMFNGKKGYSHTSIGKKLQAWGYDTNRGKA